MPMYEYQCPRCHVIIELKRNISERDEPVTCSNLDCMHKECIRIISASTFRMNPWNV